MPPELGEIFRFLSASSFMVASALVVGFFLACPPFSTKLLPMRAKIPLAIALGFVLSPQFPQLPSAPLVLNTAIALISGVAHGFFIRLLFIAFDLLGEMVANGMGLSFPGQVSAITSQSAGPAAALSQILGLAAFIQLDGLEVLISYLTHLSGSEYASALNPQFAATLTHTLERSILLGLQVAAPIWVALLIANVGLLLASRLAGGLNLMNSGFAILCALGLVMIALWLVPASNEIAQRLIEALATR